MHSKRIGALDQSAARIDEVITQFNRVARLYLQVLGQPFVYQNLIVTHSLGDEFAPCRSYHRIRSRSVAGPDEIGQISQDTHSVGYDSTEGDIVCGVDLDRVVG